MDPQTKNVTRIPFLVRAQSPPRIGWNHAGDDGARMAKHLFVKMKPTQQFESIEEIDRFFHFHLHNTITTR
jgi:hypothetical protein